MSPLLRLCLVAPLVLAAAPEPVAIPAKPPSSVPRVVQQVPPEQAEAILGRRVAGPDGKDVGRLVDVLVDGDGVPQAAVIDFGGFMGVGNRRIAVRWDTLHFAPADPKHPIALDMTPDEIKAAPAYSDPTKPVPVVTSEPAPTAEAAVKAGAAPAPLSAPSPAAAPAPAPSEDPASPPPAPADTPAVPR